jgi:hypothetical protein
VREFFGRLYIIVNNMSIAAWVAILELRCAYRASQFPHEAPIRQQKAKFTLVLTSVTLDPCLAEDGSVRNRVNSPELAPLPVNLES